jgi:hypothetical protein
VKVKTQRATQFERDMGPTLFRLKSEFSAPLALATVGMTLHPKSLSELGLPVPRTDEPSEITPVNRAMQTRFGLDKNPTCNIASGQLPKMQLLMNQMN